MTKPKTDPLTKHVQRDCSRGRPFNLVGKKFGRLTPLCLHGKRGRQNVWLCKCDCGNEHLATASLLNCGAVTSCGCAKSEPKHGELVGGTVSSEYICWSNMKQRCQNDRNPEYKNYGARGISVCDRWRDSFETFLSDMGRKPTPDHSIDRIDVDGDYEPSNCRWTTIKKQNDNKRQSVMITAFGETLSVTSMAKKYGINPTTLSYRLKFVSPEHALTKTKYKRGAYAQHHA
ncbi:hypothetical protein [Trabulsiella odontotermitis]|uniref:hypothetical protein n=1 Tax=Trabulsiella odontotermitis TaxID=379893 RepID=UPI000A5F429E|nr:hypothetical protein [Trabulsiella odontotermitis]